MKQERLIRSGVFFGAIIFSAVFALGCSTCARKAEPEAVSPDASATTLAIQTPLKVFTQYQGAAYYREEKGQTIYTTLVWEAGAHEKIYRLENADELLYIYKGAEYTIKISNRISEDAEEFSYPGVAVERGGGEPLWLFKPASSAEEAALPKMCESADSSEKCQLFSSPLVRTIAGHTASIAVRVSMDTGGAQPLSGRLYRIYDINTGEAISLKELDEEDKFQSAIGNLSASEPGKAMLKSLQKITPYLLGVFWQMGRPTLGFDRGARLAAGAMRGSEEPMTPQIEGTSLRLSVRPEGFQYYPVNKELLPDAKFKECAGSEYSAFCILEGGELIRVVYKGKQAHSIAKRAGGIIAPIYSTHISAETLAKFKLEPRSKEPTGE